MEYLGTNKPINSIQPKVSVCITAYNHEAFIAECLDSVLMQETDFPFEIILGEDYSNDATREICKQYAEKYPDKIRLFLRHAKDKIFINGRKTGSFNFMENLKAARGDYIAFCDGDDYWLLKDKLQMQYEFMLTHNTCHMLCHKMPSFMKSKTGWYDFKALAKVAYLPHCSNYFMKAFDIKKYEQAFYDFVGAEMLVLYIAAKEGMVYHHNTPVSYYRFNENGVFSSLDHIQKLEGALYQLKIIQRHFKMPRLTYIRRKINCLGHYSVATNKNPHAFIYKSLITIHKTMKKLQRC